MKIFKGILFVLLLLFGVVFIFTPYRKHSDIYDGSRFISNEILINAPAGKVYQYLGDSDNASTWSVFVDHIIPLNADSIPDGQVGSRRRCYKNADQKGLQWDETILINETNKRRRISCYNLKGFPMVADNIATEQIYTPTGDDRTNLEFTVFYLREPDQWTFFKTIIGGWYIKYIFYRNMENIKKEVENLPL